MAVPDNKHRLTSEQRSFVRKRILDWHQIPKQGRQHRTLAALAKELGISACYASRIRSRIPLPSDELIEREWNFALAHYEKVVAKTVRLAIAGDYGAQRLYFTCIAPNGTGRYVDLADETPRLSKKDEANINRKWLRAVIQTACRTLRQS